MEPIRPHEVKEKQIKSIPPEVIKVFNDLIVKHYNGRSAMIKQDEALSKVMEALSLSSNQVFENKLLDVEDVFRQAGWSVVYDKPGYNESYNAFWTFKPTTYA